MLIGLFIPLSWHWHWPKLWPMISGVIESARSQGATVFVFGDTSNSDHIDSVESEGFQPEAMQALDGYIFAFPNATLSRYAQVLHERGEPVMLIGRRSGAAPRVICDNFNAIRSLVVDFVARGHRRVGFLAGAAGNLCAEERLRGYRRGLEEAGVPYDADLVIQGDLSEMLARSEVEARVRAGLEFSALIATNDLTAIAAMDALKAVGHRIPEDVEVTGFDNVPRSHWSGPRLSTFDMQAYQLGHVAVSNLVRRAKGELIVEETLIAIPFVARSSTKSSGLAGTQAMTSEWTEGEFFCARQIDRLRDDPFCAARLKELQETPLHSAEYLVRLRALLDAADAIGVGASSLYSLVGDAIRSQPTAHGAQVVRAMELLSSAAVDEPKKNLETGIFFSSRTLPLRELSFESVEENVVIERLRTALLGLKIRAAGLFLQAVGSGTPFPGRLGSWWNLIAGTGPMSADQAQVGELRENAAATAAFVFLPLHYHGRVFGQLILDADSRFIVHYPDLMGQLAAALHGARMHSALAKANRELESARNEAEATNDALAKSYEALRSSEYFYHSLVESLPQFIVRKDAEGRFTYVNSAFAKSLERSIEQIVGKFGHEIYSTDQAHKDAADDARVMESAQPLEFETIVESGGRRRYLHVKKIPIFSQDEQCLGVQALYWDMTVFRETEEQLKKAQRELIETSRLAGIAEMATGVLHNIGNALNSVNTSAGISAERMRQSKIPGVAKIAELLEQNRTRLPEFLTQDPRGSMLIDYLAKLAAALREEQETSIREFDALRERIEHLNQIVAAQQGYANVSAVTETVEPAELMEYALRLSDAALSRHQITLVREFMPASAVQVQRQRALQILVNLVNNAKDALQTRVPGDRQIRLAVQSAPNGRVKISVTDNGVGIAPENLTRVFGFGFTTKKNGHGFGLHSSALAAKEMHGSLHAYSDGLNKGSTFVLELPAAPLVASTAPTLNLSQAHSAA